jgi:hypothetical protein
MNELKRLILDDAGTALRLAENRAKTLQKAAERAQKDKEIAAKLKAQEEEE